MSLSGLAIEAESNTKVEKGLTMKLPPRSRAAAPGNSPGLGSGTIELP